MSFDEPPAVEGGEAAAAAVTICGACEDLLAGLATRWPGGEADRALERLRARVEALLVRPVTGREESPAARGAPRLEIRALGPTRLSAGGSSIEPPRRSRLVLQYLVAHRARPVQRDTLIETFWPGSSPESARNCLNVSITLLRRCLRPVYADRPVVVFRDEAYLLHPALEIWVDAEEYERLARQGAERHRAGDHAAAVRLLGAARELYRGPLFADEPYEEWIAAARRSMEADHLTLLTRLGASLAAQGAPDEAAAVYRDALAAEPEREDVHRLLMELYAADGRTYLSLRQYQACESALRRRLGVEPGPDTRAALERILGRHGERGTARKHAVIAA